MDISAKSIYYSKLTYEEAILAKESAIRTETAITDFIKEQSSRNDPSENNNIDFKGSHKKKHFWYTVSNIILG
jgi:hypothetical protein